MKVVDRLDGWWQHRSENRRLDRAPANLAIVVGLMVPAGSIALRGPASNSFIAGMATSTQIAMCSCIFVGLAICLHGMCMGSRFYFPDASLTRCYKKAAYGGPLAFVGLAVYTFFLATSTPDMWGTLNIFLTPALGLGIIGQMFLYWLDVRRIRNNKATFTESAKIRQQVSDELSDDS